MSFDGDHGWFESASEESVGIICTRDKYGRLTSQNGHITQPRTRSDNEMKGAICSETLKNGLYSPVSLFFICLDFIARNIHMVESLFGFPDVVGEQLFGRVYANHELEEDTSQNMELFSEAYPELVLSKLCLSGQALVLNSKLECLKCFPYLTELDVSHCRLGKSHELLTHISNMQSLLRVSLKDNCLGDGDVGHMTLPVRLLGRGLCNLSTLDLSQNPKITGHSFKYLSKLTKLASLNLSATGVKDVIDLTRSTLLHWTCDGSSFKQPFTTTEGWATVIIDKWVTGATTRKKKPICSGQRLKFYKDTDNTEKTEKHKEKDNITITAQTLFLTSANCVGTSCSIKPAQNHYSDLRIAQETRKRKYLKYQTNSQKKRLKPCLSQHNAESDEDLMQSYISCGGHPEIQRKKQCLLDALVS
ncbi:leucine-rich repeat-containing protein 42 isoform X2 [Nematostella vectensis]|uniref:leucine-rich repeat-containing protein 42 isoform X2 n=1 Tax=Nematostella vectensis TaxID=45351 RepID=UPI0020771BFA|nr:leucine-rich repeat-containing protein 42 isoform X2 [Nematostella vectensis]